MFRRRPPRRRPPRRRLPVAGPRQAALRMLRQANRLMDGEQYEQAFPLLKRLADGAARHGMDVRAANLYLRAARARLEMGSAQDALALARRAIQLLVGAGQVERVRGMLPRIVDTLEEKGHRSEAVALRAEMRALLGSTSTAQQATRRGTLPSQCPSCNGPMRADEADWIDDRSAECAYCGSVVQASSSEEI